MAIPGELAHPSNESSWGLAVQRVRTLVQKRTRIPSCGLTFCLSRDSFAPAWPSYQSGGSRGQCGWNLAGASRNVAETSTRETKHYTRRVGELRFITLAGPEELGLQALSSEKRGYRLFYTRTLPGSSPSRIQGFPQEDGVSE